MDNPTPYIEQLNKLRFLMLEVYISKESEERFNKALHTTSNPYELRDYTTVLSFIDVTVTILVTQLFTRKDEWTKKLKFCNELYKIAISEKHMQEKVVWKVI